MQQAAWQISKKSDSFLQKICFKFVNKISGSFFSYKNMSIFVDFGNFLLNPYLRKIFTLSSLPVVLSSILHYSDFDRVEKLFLKMALAGKWKLDKK